MFRFYSFLASIFFNSLYILAMDKPAGDLPIHVALAPSEEELEELEKEKKRKASLLAEPSSTPQKRQKREEPIDGDISCQDLPLTSSPLPVSNYNYPMSQPSLIPPFSVAFPFLFNCAGQIPSSSLDVPNSIAKGDNPANTEEGALISACGMNYQDPRPYCLLLNAGQNRKRGYVKTYNVSNLEKGFYKLYLVKLKEDARGSRLFFGELTLEKTEKRFFYMLDTDVVDEESKAIAAKNSRVLQKFKDEFLKDFSIYSRHAKRIALDPMSFIGLQFDDPLKGPYDSTYPVLFLTPKQFETLNNHKDDFWAGFWRDRQEAIADTARYPKLSELKNCKHVKIDGIENEVPIERIE